jgi:hypothetical protein
MTRKYSSTSVQQLLDASIGAADTSLSLDNTSAVTALLGGVTLTAGNVDQFTIAIDPDTASEEIIFVRGTSGNQLTGLLRGQAGTSATTHTAGATIKHVLTSNDLDYYTAGVDNSITASSTTTLTNKTINLSSNTLSGTTAQFNTALSDGNFATIAGTETLTNKTLTSPVISDISNTGTLTLPTSTDTLVGRATTDTLTNKTLTSPTVDDPKLNLSVNAQTGTTYTFALTDNGKFVTASNSSAQTYSIPTNASVAFPVGTQIHIIQIGSGQVTIQAASSGTTTVLSIGATAASPKISKQYAAATCIKTATDTWYVIGNLA